MAKSNQHELRILHVINDFSIAAGAEGMLARLTAKLLEHDVKSRVVSLGNIGTLGQKAIAAGVGVTALGIKSIFDLPAGIFKLSAEIKKYDPHIIQTWLYHSDILGLMANWISGNRPFVWNLRCSNIDLYGKNDAPHSY